MKTEMRQLGLAVLLFILSLPAATQADEQKRDLILEYFEYVGVIDSINLQIETMRLDYEKYYSYLPGAFWEDPRVVELFDGYKVALLRGYVEAMEEAMSDEDLEFLVDFYSSKKGRRVVELGKQVDPLMVSAASEAGNDFTTLFTELLESGDLSQ